MSFNDANYEPIECPFCGGKQVWANVMTSMYFKKVARVYKNGVDYYNNANEKSIETMGDIFGEPYLEPTINLTSFDCSSCKKHWISEMYQLVKDDNGIYSFVKKEKGKKRGTKTNGKGESEDAEIH